MGSYVDMVDTTGGDCHPREVESSKQSRHINGHDYASSFSSGESYTVEGLHFTSPSSLFLHNRQNCVIIRRQSPSLYLPQQVRSNAPVSARDANSARQSHLKVAIG